MKEKMLTQTLESKTRGAIHPATRMGFVHLTVANLNRQIEFYQNVLGLTLQRRENGSASLGAGAQELLRLTEQSNAKRVSHTTGLYHFAILVPNRKELARVIARLMTFRYTNYPTDHVMTKSTYLNDPEGNGIEIYTESPEDGTLGIRDGEPYAERADGTASDGREPLDLDALFKELNSTDRLDVPMPSNTKIGHVHLHIANLSDAMRFYQGVLGFENQGMAPGMGAGFVSAGGYHHHVGLNTWAGKNAPPPPADALGLRYFTIVLPNASELEKVLERVQRAGIAIKQTEEGQVIRDPSQNSILLIADSNSN